MMYQSFLLCFGFSYDYLGTLHLSRQRQPQGIAPTIENGHVGAILSRNQFLRAKNFASNMVAPNIFEGCHYLQQENY